MYEIALKHSTFNAKTKLLRFFSGFSHEYYPTVPLKISDLKDFGEAPNLTHYHIFLLRYFSVLTLYSILLPYFVRKFITTTMLC